MRPVYEKDFLYDILVPYVNWSFRRVFRSLEFKGVENIPEDGAVIFSPNHVNTLLDALAVLAMRENRPVVFAARADIFRKPLVAKILNFLRIVPINRIRDGVDALAGNEQTFHTAIHTLQAGIPFCIFPEGRHSQDPGLLPLRKGIARIALQAVDEIEGPVYIVPIGLVYDDYVNFRTDLTINVGEAVLVARGRSKKTQTEPERQRKARKLLVKLTTKMKALIDTRRDKPVRDSLLLRTLRIPGSICRIAAFASIRHREVSGEEHEGQSLPEFCPLRYLLPDKSCDHLPAVRDPRGCWTHPLVADTAITHSLGLRPGDMVRGDDQESGF